MSGIETRAWFREPMVWLVIALPSTVVVAGIVTLMLALRAGGSDAIPWDVRRTAQVQQEDLAPERAAAARGVHGRLTVDPGTGAVSVSLVGVEASQDPVLQLDLVHPVRAAEDQRVMLVAGDGRWHGRIAALGAAGWILRLAPASGDWRLRGELAAGARGAALAATGEVAP